MADKPRPSNALARPLEPLPQYRIARRVLTRELAEAFAEELLSDVSHSVNSAARAIGIKPDTVKKALQRAHNDACWSLEDEEICDILAEAKEEHIRKIRGYGFVSAANGNRAGIAWMQWQSEVQDPVNHPRRQDVSLEMAGKGGGAPIAVASVQYVVMVPPDEPEEGT
jgi:hypothetical protein